MSAARRTITTGVIAARLHVQPRTVLCWISDGDLVAVDVRANKAKRATYRVLLSSFEAFLRRRGANDETVRELVSAS